MKRMFLALTFLLCGSFSHATETTYDLVYRCDAKGSDKWADIYWTSAEKFVLCFKHSENAHECKKPILSEDHSAQNGEIMIDFHYGWDFEGDAKGGMLTGPNDKEFICSHVDEDQDE